MNAPSNRIRAGNQDRERVATRLQEASGEGRLSLGKADDRLAAAYAATYLDELTGLTRDLPEPATPKPPRFPVPLRVHAAVVHRSLRGHGRAVTPARDADVLAGCEPARARGRPRPAAACAILISCSITRTDFSTGSGLRLP